MQAESIWLFLATLDRIGINSVPLKVLALFVSFFIFARLATKNLSDKRPLTEAITSIKSKIDAI